MSSEAFAVGGEDGGRGRLVVELSSRAGDGSPRKPGAPAAEATAEDLFLEAELFSGVVRGAASSCGFGHVTLTARATTPHPDFARIFEAAGVAGLTTDLALDGEQFEAFWPAVAPRRETLTRVTFRLGGADAESHDGLCGAGSFNRLVRAFTRCRAAGLPFGFDFEAATDSLPRLEQVALFAARLGAAGLVVRHAPAPGEETDGRVADEVAALARVLRMPVVLAPCCTDAGCRGGLETTGRLIGRIDSRGRLSLPLPPSCVGAGAAGGHSADLAAEEFAAAFERLRGLAGARAGRAASPAGPAGAGRGRGY
ncbi:MAG TPA: hypothetical protein VEY09_01510 [Pyrinomonadaceae bacterium]|nr:hypothetical protein [Pyrinomonadaceae bacterium]